MKIVSVIVLSVTLVATLCAGTAAALEPTTASQVVTVINSPSSAACPGQFSFLQRVDQQQHPDGTTSSFTIPLNRVLVVQSYDWTGGAFPAGPVFGVRLVIVDSMGTGNGSIGSVALTTASVEGTGFGNVVVSPGFVVKSGAILCVGAIPTNGSITVIVHGFITNDK
jgi:hypothetical protein